jgi:hypothetical protein
MATKAHSLDRSHVTNQSVCVYIYIIKVCVYIYIVAMFIKLDDDHPLKVTDKNVSHFIILINHYRLKYIDNIK